MDWAKVARAMRFSRLLAPTLKEDPADAELASHRLLVRAGMIRQVARGIYDFLPLGLRALRKVEAIVRDELDRAGCQEILLPATCPAELWQESGRWEAFGRELLRLKDRYGREFCFGPTHEEVVTDLVRRDVRSYRDLPLNLYQIQVKFRDELRPRFGLLRGREFIMKDGYSFHADQADCRREYEHMFATYERIFRRCGLAFRAVEADTGAIGGTLSHEFQVLAGAGEDALAVCQSCGYAANVEKAEVAAGPSGPAGGKAGPLRVVDTPGRRTVAEVSSFLGEPPERFIKTLIYTCGDGQVVAALVRGDHELAEAKLRAALGCQQVRMADPETVERTTGAPPGFAGPVGLSVRLVADLALRGSRGMVSGANRVDAHLTGIDVERDLPGLHFADLRRAAAGDTCARCGGVLDEQRGIEVGQVFYLGTKYSASMRATFLDASGNERPIEMGTYGIGISRTVAAAVEQHHDEAGIIWPLSLAPYAALVLPLNTADARLRETAERLAAELAGAGVETLLDDRDERAGVKFKDADLLGIPYRLTVGPRAFARGMVELKARAEKEAREVPVSEAAARVAAAVREALRS